MRGLVLAILLVSTACAAPLLDPGPLGPFPAVAGSDPTCGTGAPVTATSGEGPSGLVFAAIKTGFRAVIVWRTDEPVRGRLAWNVSGGPAATVVEDFERTEHAIVLDRLPIGESLCFTPEGLPPRALSLRNAMNAFEADAYVINLLVVANEQPNRETLARGFSSFASRLRDMTDGHVKAGRMVVLLGDVTHANTGLAGCALPMFAVDQATTTPPLPTCDRSHDVLVTIDGNPTTTAATSLDAIADPVLTIFVNWNWHGGLVDLDDDLGYVLAHEMGHYAFGQTDMPSCFEATSGMSVMSGQRQTVELDGASDPCPAPAAGYVPSWTLLRARFPLIPERAAITRGPSGEGDAFAYHPVVFLPHLDERVDDALGDDPNAPPDDAASGRDAPAEPDPSFLVEPGRSYEGNLTPGLDRDVYGFRAEAGDLARVTLSPSMGCLDGVIMEGSRNVTVGTACVVGLDRDTWTARLPYGGLWYVDVEFTRNHRFDVTLSAG